MKKIRSKNPAVNSDNVFEDLGFSSDEARILALKAQLAAFIVRAVKQRKLTQKQLSSIWGVPQPRVSEVLSGKLSLVSIDRLIEFLAMLGVDVAFKARVSSDLKKRIAG